MNSMPDSIGNLYKEEISDTIKFYEKEIFTLKKLKKFARNNPKLKPGYEFRHIIKSIKKIKGMNAHHWSYNEKDIMDVIYLTKSDHSMIHNYIRYDKKTKYYRTKIKGILLNTRKRHLDYINKRGWIKEYYDKEINENRQI